MTKPSLALLATAVTLVAWHCAPGEQQPAPTQSACVGPASLQPLFSEAVSKSAELAALQARIKAAEAMFAPAKALPDPMASVGLVDIPVHHGIRLNQDTMSGFEVMLSQDVPRSQKRRLSGQIQSSEALMLRARYHDRRNNLIKSVKQAYFELQYLDEAINITEQNKTLAQDMQEAAEAQYSTGKGMLQDVFQAQVRLSQMIDMLLDLRQQRATAASRLNKLLYRPQAEPVPEVAALQQTPLLLDVGGLTDLALSASPQLQEMRVKEQQQQTRVQLARQEIRPDYRFEFRYMVRQKVEMDPMSGTDMWSAIVGINLPWVYRRERADQDVKAAQAEQSAASQEVAAMRNELAQMIEGMVLEIRRADQQISLIDTALLPQAEGALASSRTSYETGQLPFVSMLDNQMNLYNQQVRRIELLQEREKNAAELEYLVGGALPCPEVPGGGT